MAKKVNKTSDEELILKQGFKMGATAAFVVANYPLDDITDELLESMFNKLVALYCAKKNIPQ